MVEETYQWAADRELMDLLARAKESGKILVSNYDPDIWFTADALKESMANGKFRWGPVNWRLEDPIEKINYINKKIQALCAVRTRLERASDACFSVRRDR